MSLNEKGYLPIYEAINIIEHAEFLIANRYPTPTAVMALSREGAFISLI